MNSFSKQAPDVIAKEQGFIRDNLEKVMRLVDTLKYFQGSKRFPQIRSQLLPVLRRSERFDFEQVKTAVKSFLSNLLVLTDTEMEYVAKFNHREYAPELLFDDNDIVERVKSHPMALWKTRQQG